MRRRILLILIGYLFSGKGFSQTVLFDAGWRFHRGGAQRAEAPGFDDSKWRAIDLPHDWSIEDLPGKSSPFDPDAIGQVSTGFTVGGTGWYRKHFSIPAAQKNKRILIQFDGVYMNSDVWINGELLGNHPYGYTSFWFDITDKIKFGDTNIMAVQVKNEGNNSRWYSGSGIYRHVWLKMLDPLFVSPWGIHITTAPTTARTTALTANASFKASIKTEIENQRGEQVVVTLVTRVLDSSGNEIGKTESKQQMNAKSSHVIEQEILLKNVLPWSVDSPFLYTAVTELSDAVGATDRVETKFGFRTISFDASNGFRLNGKSMKLKGGCIHHDNGPLGSKAFDRAEQRKIELLKASGYNAIRCSHNPPSPALLNACDQLGMMVIDEAFDMWKLPNNPHDYHLFFDDWWKKDIESMVRRDRNHPSVIIWSIGNEIRGMEMPEIIHQGKMLADYVRMLDPTRPVTAAVNNLRPEKDPFFANLDVCGYNYAAGGDHLQESLYKQDHLRLSDRVMMGTESYPLESFEAWMGVNDNNWVVGDFVWTAVDYIGEASIGWRGYWQEQDFYPWNLAFCGDIDICGWKRPQSYYRDALWKENQVSVFVKPPRPSFPLNPAKQSWSKWEWQDMVADWNWMGFEDSLLEVSAYSSCEEAELFINGKSFGRKATNRETKFIANWEVNYQPGVLKVIGYRNGKQVNERQLATAKKVAQIKLTSDRRSIKTNGQDLAYVTVELVDGNGVRNPKAEDLISFKVAGGQIAGVGNANPVSLESYLLPQRKAWQGRCLVILKAPGTQGDIILTAFSQGLPASKLVVHAGKD